MPINPEVALAAELDPIEFGMGGEDGIAGGELDPGREPDALVHRREAIADFHIDHRTRERGVTGAAVVAVVAALDAERQRDAER